MSEQSEHNAQRPETAAHAPSHAPGEESSLHERTDANVKGIVYFAAGLALFVFLVCLGLWGMMKMYIYRTLHEDLNLARQQSPVAADEHPPDPVLQPTIDIHPTKAWQDVAAMNAANQRVLTSYGWVDARHGVARIPLSNAVDLLVTRGLPAELPATEPTTQPIAPTTALSPTLPPESAPNFPSLTPGGQP